MLKQSQTPAASPDAPVDTRSAEKILLDDIRAACPSTYSDDALSYGDVEWQIKMYNAWQGLEAKEDDRIHEAAGPLLVAGRVRAKIFCTSSGALIVSKAQEGRLSVV